MPETDDIALLRDYAQRKCEEAFATLVSRHVNLVFSVALRHTGNAHEAEEIKEKRTEALAPVHETLGGSD